MMLLGLGIAGVSEIVGAFGGRKCSEDFADCDADSFGRARGGLAQQVLELGEDLFDRVQVRRVFRQEEELGPGWADELAHRFGFVTTEIVHDHDVAAAKRKSSYQLTHTSMIACCRRNCTLAARSRTQASPPIVLGYSRRMFEMGQSLPE